MRCGIFGKLPSRRDFVTRFAPRDFLDVWEPWIDGGLRTSQVHLGSPWRESYLAAPIWRFWLGADICRGITVAGAFMPSVDGAGRCYPLTVFLPAPAPAAILHPEIDPQNGWFSQLEAFLISAVARYTSFEAVLGKLERLEPASAYPDWRLGEDIDVMLDGTLVALTAAAPLQERLAAMRATDYARAYATRSVWWTMGGKDYPSTVLVGQLMPSLHVFPALLTGRFGSRAP